MGGESKIVDVESFDVEGDFADGLGGVGVNFGRFLRGVSEVEPALCVFNYLCYRFENAEFVVGGHD